MEEVCVALATKGAFKNKVLFDNQIITRLNLMDMAIFPAGMLGNNRLVVNVGGTVIQKIRTEVTKDKNYPYIYPIEDKKGD